MSLTQTSAPPTSSVGLSAPPTSFSLNSSSTGPSTPPSGSTRPYTTSTVSFPQPINSIRPVVPLSSVTLPTTSTVPSMSPYTGTHSGTALTQTQVGMGTMTSKSPLFVTQALLSTSTPTATGQSPLSSLPFTTSKATTTVESTATSSSTSVFSSSTSKNGSTFNFTSSGAGSYFNSSLSNKSFSFGSPSSTGQFVFGGDNTSQRSSQFVFGGVNTSQRSSHPPLNVSPAISNTNTAVQQSLGPSTSSSHVPSGLTSQQVSSHSSMLSTPAVLSQNTSTSQSLFSNNLFSLSRTTSTPTSQTTTTSQQSLNQPPTLGISSTASQIFPNSQQSQLDNFLPSPNLAVSSATTTTSQPLGHSQNLGSSAVSSSQPSSHSLTSDNVAISSIISETTQTPPSHPSTSISPTISSVASQTTIASQQSSSLTTISRSPVMSGTPSLQRPLSFPLGATALPTSPLTVSLQSIPKTVKAGVGKFSEDKEDVSSNGTESFSLSAPTSHSGSSADLNKTTPTPPPLSGTMVIAGQIKPVTSQTVTTTSGQQTPPTTTPLNIALSNAGPVTTATSTSLIGQTSLIGFKSSLTSNQGGVGSDQAAEAIGLLNLATGEGEVPMTPLISIMI